MQFYAGRFATGLAIWLLVASTSLVQQVGAQPAANDAGYVGLVADDRQTQGQGVRVVEAVANGPAAQAGLRAEDLITQINGRPIRSMEDFGGILQRTRVGEVLTIDFQRNGRNARANVTLVARPAEGDRRFPNFGEIQQPPDAAAGQPNPGRAPGGVQLGVRTAAIDEAARARLRLPSTFGALITEVVPGSSAEQSGLRPNDAVVAIDRFVINRPSDLADVINQKAAGDTLSFALYREGRFRKIDVALVAGAGGRAEPLPAPAGPRNVQGPPAAAGPALGPPRAEPPADDRIERLEALVTRLLDRIDELEQRLDEALPPRPLPPRDDNDDAPDGDAPDDDAPAAENGIQPVDEPL